MLNRAALQQAAFSSFDPDFADGAPIGAKVVEQMGAFTLTIASTATVPLIVELFNANKSFTHTKNPDYAVTNFPYNTVGALGAADGVIGPMAGLVGFNEFGHLRINGNTTGNGFVTVTCLETSYKALLESSRVAPFRISKIRMTFSNVDAIDKQLVHFTTSWLGGGKENRVNPGIFYKPDQFQSLIVDVPLNGLPIDGERGIKYIITPQRTVTMSFFVESFVKTDF